MIAIDDTVDAWFIFDSCSQLLQGDRFAKFEILRFFHDLNVNHGMWTLPRPRFSAFHVAGKWTLWSHNGVATNPTRSLLVFSKAVGTMEKCVYIYTYVYRIYMAVYHLYDLYV